MYQIRCDFFIVLIASSSQISFPLVQDVTTDETDEQTTTTTFLVTYAQKNNNTGNTLVILTERHLLAMSSAI